MSERHYRAQLTIPALSGVPADSVVNTWHFIGLSDNSDALNASDFAAQLDAFYDEFIPVFGSNVMDWAESTIKFYVFEDPAPRIPFAELGTTFALPTASKNDWPAEMSIVLSMEAVRVSGANMARRRGRVFLGPLAVGPGDLAAMGTGVPDLIAGWADAAFFGAGRLTDLAIYSPSTHHGVPKGESIKDYPDEVPALLPQSFSYAVKLWVNDTWDVQRRRGTRETYRKTYTK